MSDDYDAGLLSDYGGGNVGWWHDYIRAEIERANDHWRLQQDDAIRAARIEGYEIARREAASRGLHLVRPELVEELK